MAYLHCYCGHVSKGCNVYTVQECTYTGRVSYSWDKRIADGYKDKRWQKNSDSCEYRHWKAPQYIAYEGRCGKYRTRCYLANGYGVNQLLVCEPAEAGYEVRTQEGEKDIAASI